jgi:diadenosine tetraphosphate (Ap4A) HIT family hydrolase
MNDHCDLCRGDGGELLVRTEKYRVIAVDGVEGASYQGYCRVVWNAHVKELTDLSSDERAHFMNAVYRLEAALRLSLVPDKMNVASLGNLTPHLHWHLVPRWANDAAYPKPIWAVTLPQTTSQAVATLSEIDWRDAVKRAFASEAVL